MAYEPLCVISAASKSVFGFWRLWDIAVFDDGVLLVPTTLGASVRGAANKGKGDEWDAWRAEKAADLGEAVRSRDELLTQTPGSRFISGEEIVEARIHRGLVDCRLVMHLSDGTRLKRVWTAGDGWRRQVTASGPIWDVAIALRELLGPRLVWE